jgi:hypothetical protein
MDFSESEWFSRKSNAFPGNRMGRARVPSGPAGSLICFSRKPSGFREGDLVFRKAIHFAE